MHALRKYVSLLLVVNSSFISCNSQHVFGTEHLQLIKTISLPEVKGRIDHMDVNMKDQIVYVAALGNNTLEAIDLRKGSVIHSIKNLDEPQGVGYIPQHQEIVVANGGSGVCYFYNAKTFEKTGTVKLSSDADDIRYDSVAQKIYVGYGSGGIAIIDADTHQQVGNIKLPVHPEGFQLDDERNTLYVNLPDMHMVAVADLKALQLVKEWHNKELSANFPIAVDKLHQRIFVGYRHPPKLVALDAKNGAMISTSNIVGDTDDLYYDPENNRVFISGGAGIITVYQEEGSGFRQIASIPTRAGARTSLLVPTLHLYIVAARASFDKEAQLLIYKPN